jgi:hypothetical protein
MGDVYRLDFFVLRVHGWERGGTGWVWSRLNDTTAKGQMPAPAQFEPSQFKGQRSVASQPRAKPWVIGAKPSKP